MQNHRVMTALITPFNKDNLIDFTALGKLIDDCITHGNDGFVMLGTTAEASTLNKDERWMLYHFIMRYVNGRVPVYAGVGTNDTEESLVYLKMAEEAKADGIMAVTPYYNRPQQEGLFQHFKTLAINTKLPMMVYTVPGRCSVHLAADTMIRLANEYSNIQSLKFACGDVHLIPDILSGINRKFVVYTGEDGMLLEGLRVGMSGVVSVIGHIYGDEIRQVVEAYEQGIEHIELDAFLKQKTKDLFCETSPVPIKYALHVLGKCEPYVRLPLVELTSVHKEQVKRTLGK